MTCSIHYHTLITLEESRRLEEHYRSRGATCARTLNTDPRFFDLAVTLPEQKHLKPTPRSMRNDKLWGQ